MAEIGNPQPEPNVGIRGNPQSLPVYKNKESLIGPGSTPNFVSSLSQLATSPTALGEIATNITTNASNKLMDKWGYELGSNPKGNLWPSITKADKRLELAYTNQAQATLGLQANKLLIDGQTELQKAYKLTPGMIESYKANMAKGLDDILSDAPDNLKPLLHNEFSNTLLRSSSQLDEKMINQQKQQYKEQMAAYSQIQNKNIYENAMSGKGEEARLLLESQLAKNKQLKDAGIISPIQEENNNQTARQTYLTGINSQQALAAKKEGKLEEFLTSLEKKPEGVSFLDWQAVTKNVLSNVNEIESLERRDQTLNASQFDLAIIENRVTPEVIEELKQKQTPLNFTQSMIKYASHLNKQKNSNDEQGKLISNWGSPVAHADASVKIRNNSFQVLAKAYQQRQINNGQQAVSDIEAKTLTAQQAGAEIPQFTNELNNMLLSGNPDLMVQASGAYRVLGDLKAPLSKQAKAMLFRYESQLPGKTSLEAAEIAKQTLAPKTPDEIKAQDIFWDDYRKTNLSTLDKQVSHAKSLMDIPWFTKIPNLDTLTVRVNNAFESNLRLLGNDVSAAKEMTKHDLSQGYGLTYANGYKEYAYLPVEKFVGIDDPSVTGIIQHEVASQAMEQFKATKDAFDKGANKFYYRIAEKQTIDSALAIRKEIEDINSNKENKNLSSQEAINQNQRKIQLQKELEEFYSYKPIIVERVWDGGQVEKFELAYQASPTMGLGINSNTPIVGGYDISVRTPGGKLRPLIGVDNLSNGHLVYKPDINKLRMQYFALHGFSNPSQAYERQKEILIARRKFQEEELPHAFRLTNG